MERERDRERERGWDDNDLCNSNRSAHCCHGLLVSTASLCLLGESEGGGCLCVCVCVKESEREREREMIALEREMGPVAPH